MRRTIRRATIVMTMGIAITSLAALVPQEAFASWNAAGSVNGYSKATTMPTGNQPAGSVTGRNVTLTWAASMILGSPVSGYAVARYTTGGVLQSIGASCSGTISALTCTEAAVPAGTWKYGITPKQGLWLGTEGTQSANVTVAAATLTFTSPTTVYSLPTSLNGNLSGYATGEALTFRLDNPSTGTVLTGSTVPSPIQNAGTATFSVTIPAGTSLGAHTVYGVGSLGTQASAGITVADNVAPTVSAAVINKSTGDTPGFIKRSQAYFVYANVTDAAPSSGISTVTANVTNITAGTTAAAMTTTGGPWTVGGVSYNYRSASLTSGGALTAGAKTFTITATDVSANSVTQGGFSVTVDLTAPTGSDVQTANTSGGTVGKAEAGDTIVFTYSEPIDPNSILAAWDGTSTNVTVRLNNGPGVTNDTITIFNSANSSQLPLGSINVGAADYTTANRTFTTSTMVMSGNTITITLGTASGAVTTSTTPGNMAWTPSATATDRAANACATTVTNESGASNLEF
jgi:hypothetical protein